jgi:hypothetical protein
VMAPGRHSRCNIAGDSNLLKRQRLAAMNRIQWSTCAASPLPCTDATDSWPFALPLKCRSLRCWRQVRACRQQSVVSRSTVRL